MQTWEIFLLIFVPIVLVLVWFIIRRILTQKNVEIEEEWGPITILICGIHGKMGAFLANSLATDYIIVGYDIKDEPCDWPTYTSLSTALATKPDAVLDFTSANCAEFIITETLKQGIPVISGTTGLPLEMLEDAAKIAKQKNTSFISLVNYTSGIKLLIDFIKLLPDSYQATISESHHISKKDAPSGTALLLSEFLKVKREEIVAERVEEYAPKHTITLEGNGETISITHQVFNQNAYLPLIKRYLDLVMREDIVEINYIPK